MSRRDLGRRGEDIALHYLTQEGFVVVRKNFFVRGGEIDLIMQKDALLIFVEVKWRRQKNFGSAAEGITWQKRRRLRSAVVQYLMRYPHAGPIRIDAVLLDGPAHSLHITHLRDIG